MPIDLSQKIAPGDIPGALFQPHMDSRVAACAWSQSRRVRDR